MQTRPDHDGLNRRWTQAVYHSYPLGQLRVVAELDGKDVAVDGGAVNLSGRHEVQGTLVISSSDNLAEVAGISILSQVRLKVKQQCKILVLNVIQLKWTNPWQHGCRLHAVPSHRLHKIHLGRQEDSGSC